MAIFCTSTLTTHEKGHVEFGSFAPEGRGYGIFCGIRVFRLEGRRYRCDRGLIRRSMTGALNLISFIMNYLTFRGRVIVIPAKIECSEKGGVSG